jgi:hypothetical protein
VSNDPIRFRDPLSDAPPELKSLLARAHDDLPTQAELARLAARAAPLFAAPVAVSALGLSAKLGLVAIGLSGAALIAVGVAHDPEAPSPTNRPAEQAQVAPAAQPESPPARAVPAPVAPQPSLLVPEPEKAVPSADTAKRAEKPSAKAGGPSEAELLERARRLVGSNPAGALELAQQHRARFAGGVLAQEREVIAIDALRRLGRVKEAEARAQAFERAFPNSAHRRKLESGSR